MSIDRLLTVNLESSRDESQTSGADERVYEYKWSLGKALKDLLNDENFNDVCFLTSDGKMVFGIRVILASASKVFREMFRERTVRYRYEPTSVEPIGLNIDQVSLVNIIKLIYFNKVIISQDQQMAFHHYLRQFGIKASIEEHKDDKENKNPSQFTDETRNPTQFENETKNPNQFKNETRNPSQFENETKNSTQFKNETRNPNQSENETKNPSQFENETKNPNQFKNETKNHSQFENETKNPSQFRNWTQDQMMDRFGKLSKDGFECMVPNCRAILGSKSGLKQHFRDYHIESGATYICPKCNAATSSQTAYAKHKYKYHADLKNDIFWDLRPKPIFGDRS